MRKFKNVANVQPSPGYSPGGKSQTVPDQSMTPQEILLRFTQGKPVPGYQPQYYDGVLMPDIDAMDLTELQEYKDRLSGQIDDLADTYDNLQEQITQRKKRDEQNNATNDDAFRTVVPE